MPLISDSTVIADGASTPVNHTMVFRNNTNVGNAYGSKYIEPADSDLNPTIESRYDETPSGYSRKLVQIKGWITVGTEMEQGTVNFTATLPDGASDEDKEALITYALNTYAVANFASQVVDGIS